MSRDLNRFLFCHLLRDKDGRLAGRDETDKWEVGGEEGEGSRDEVGQEETDKWEVGGKEGEGSREGMGQDETDKWEVGGEEGKGSRESGSKK